MASEVDGAPPTGPNPPVAPTRRRSGSALAAFAVAVAAVAVAAVGAVRPTAVARHAPSPAGTFGLRAGALRATLDERLVVAARMPDAAPALDIAVHGDRAFVAAHGVGVHVLDIADRRAPVLRDTLATAGPALAVAAADDVLAVAAGSGGLQIFARPDVSAMPTLVATVPPTAGGHAYSVAVSGDVIWVGEWNQDFGQGDPGHGIRAIARTSDGRWAVVGQLNTPGWAADIAVAGDTAYVADGPGGLRIIDVADAGSPREVGSLATSVRAYGVAVDAATMRAYVADNEGGLVIVDVADPAAPRTLGTLATTGAVYDVACDGACQRVWVAQADGAGPADGGRVTLVDVRRPAAPMIVDEIALQQRAWGVAIDAGGRAWVAATGSGVVALDTVPADAPTPPSSATSGTTPMPAPSATPSAMPAARVLLPWAHR